MKIIIAISTTARILPLPADVLNHPATALEKPSA